MGHLFTNKVHSWPQFQLKGVNEIKAGSDVNILEIAGKEIALCYEPKAFLSVLFIVTFAPDPGGWQN